MAELLTALHKYFGFSEFRPGQREVIDQVLTGHDVMAVMPTGRGKSLCYQLPGLMLPGVTLVISPLVALMKDQVDSLHTRNLHQVTYLNSQLTAEEHKERLNGIKRGEYKLVYIAPERLRTRSFSNLLPNLPLELLVIDEAHCISQWGHDFRPDYLYIKEFVNSISKRPKVLALTATATLKVQQDILKQLGIENATRVVAGSDRPNLYLSAQKVDNGKAKLQALAEILVGEKGSGIVYTATRKDSEAVAQFLISQLGMKAAPYHAGMDPDQRAAVQDGFINDQYSVVVATNAFGMGIDKQDIRYVIHFSMPASIEAYYQEVGRAGRDGQPAKCVLLYAARDKALQEWMIENDAITREHLVIFWKAYQRNLNNGRSLLNPAELDAAGLDDNRLRLVVGALERHGVITMLERNSEYLEVEMGPVEMSPAICQAVLQESQRRGTDRRSKLSYLVNWVHAGICRREMLLEYFGEKVTDKPERCCNNCDQQDQQDVSFEPLEILRCVQQMVRGVGRKKLAAILQGSKAKDITERDYHLLTHYGKLRNRSGPELLAMIDRLLGDGYLLSSGEQYPVLELTSKGWEALSLGNPLPIPAAPVKTKGDIKIPSEFSNRPKVAPDETLLNALKEYRSSLARKNQQPPFMFFHDRVLVEIAIKKPHSLEKLGSISGIGPKKLADYGKDLLAIVGFYSK
ncbi:ATP-dependent DNA helicase RecQ [Peptococcaceae bacterium 1198_IL3148]